MNEIQLEVGVAYKIAYRIGKEVCEDVLTYETNRYGFVTLDRCLIFAHPRPFVRDLFIDRVMKPKICNTIAIPVSSIISAKKV